MECKMRLNVEITDEQHRYLKGIAALSGKSIKEYVAERLFPEPNVLTRKAFKQVEEGDTIRFSCAEDAVEFLKKL